MPLDQVKEFIRAQSSSRKSRLIPRFSRRLQQSLRDFQTHVTISIPEPQYATLAQQLTQPAPAPAAGGASPFAPAHP